MSGVGMRLALKFAYDGKQFAGYARQPGQWTVEQTLLDTLIRQGILTDAKSSCFRTASRTDRGVSALGNVCAFGTMVPQDTVFSRLTKESSEIFIYGIRKVSPMFYPRHAMRREYRYYLRNSGLDVDKILSAAALFTGEHDFRNFARLEPLKNPVRSLDAIVVSEKKDFLILDFYAQTFLWNQIRRIVSALKKAGEGTLRKQVIQDALLHPEIKVDFQLVPPEPLMLTTVVYEFPFEYQKGYKRKLQCFENGILESL